MKKEYLTSVFFEASSFYKIIKDNSSGLLDKLKSILQVGYSSGAVLELSTGFKIYQSFEQEDHFFDQLRKACEELLRSGYYILECQKDLHKPVYLEIEERFNKNLTFEDKKTKLEDVCNDKVGNDSEGFIHRRIEDAKILQKEFLNDISAIIKRVDKEAGISLYKDEKFEANAKGFKRASAKVKEMNGDPKYEKPVENSLYDLLRGRIFIGTAHDVDEPLTEYCKDNFIKFVEATVPLIDEKYGIIRLKNKMSQLGNITFNITYKTLIAEIQITLQTKDYLTAYHFLYDFSRLNSPSELNEFLGNYEPVKAAIDIAKNISDESFFKFNDEGVPEGSACYVPLLLNSLRNWNTYKPFQHAMTKMSLDYVGDDLMNHKNALSFSGILTVANEPSHNIEFAIIKQYKDFCLIKGLTNLLNYQIRGYVENVENKELDQWEYHLELTLYAASQKDIHLDLMFNEHSGVIEGSNKDSSAKFVGKFIEESQFAALLSTKVDKKSGCCNLF